jgi:flagellar biosynthesis anti-sigma factor FlgM
VALWRKHVRIDPNQGPLEGQPVDRLGSTGASKQSAGTQATRSALGQEAGDPSHLSSDALQLSNISSTLANVPDIRQTRVTQVTQGLRNGNHSVSNDQIAQSMLRDFQTSGPPGQ